MTGICNDSTETFHPKVYIIKSDNSYTAFVGSANLTYGGLQYNIELSYKIVDQSDCLKLLTWFTEIFEKSYPIDDHNIAQYTNERPVIKPILRSKMHFKKNTISPDEQKLESIDFTDRYFKKEHHYAFREGLWLDNKLSAIKEREYAVNRMLELNDLIFPLFFQYGLGKLETNTEGNIVSRHWQTNPSSPRKLGAMWMGYGKSQQDIKEYKEMVGSESSEFQTFIHHARLQIRVELLSIGIWLLFGKKNGSSFDRSNFQKNISQSDYRKKFYDLLNALPIDYWISIDGEQRNCRSFETPEELHTFCKKDRLDYYFMIGRDYNITDTEMSEENLPTTVLREFQRQYPLYELMCDKRFN